MTTPAVFTFTDHQVRTVLVNGEPWFVLADVCRALGLARGAAQVAERLPDGVRQAHPIVDSLGRTQQATVVNESGLYRVVLRSDAPNAEPFISWVTDDVIPTIRKTGRYGSDVSMLTGLPSSELLLLASQAAAALEQEAALRAQAEANVAALTPKADRWDEIASAGSDFAVDQVAKLLTRAGAVTGRNRLFATMSDLGWIYRQGTEWHAYQSATGLVVPRANRPVTDPKTGALRNVAPTIRVTGKGLDRLAEHFGVGLAVRAIAPGQVGAS